MHAFGLLLVFSFNGHFNSDLEKLMPHISKEDQGVVWPQ